MFFKVYFPCNHCAFLCFVRVSFFVISVLSYVSLGFSLRVTTVLSYVLLGFNLRVNSAFVTFLQDKLLGS